MSIHSENWDGATVPSLPSGWNATGSSNLVTTATFQGGISPTSSPNALALAASSTVNTPFAATWGTATDGNGGNVIVQANFSWAANAANQMGVFCRSGDATTSFSSSTFYFGWLEDPVPPVSYPNSVGISKCVSGTTSNLVKIIGITWQLSAWYQLALVANGGQLSLSVQRLSDGYWLGPDSAWHSSMATAVSIADGSISGAGYAGLSMMQQSTSSYIYSDDWSLTAIPAQYPTVPLVVRLPHAFYPQFSE
jgi:hypothetical protein